MIDMVLEAGHFGLVAESGLGSLGGVPLVVGVFEARNRVFGREAERDDLVEAEELVDDCRAEIGAGLLEAAGVLHDAFVHVDRVGSCELFSLGVHHLVLAVGAA